jgi:tight adherence protein B
MTFAAGALVVAGLYSILSDLYLRDRSRFGQRVDEEFRTRQRDRAKQSPLFKNLGELAAQVKAEEEAESSLSRRFESMVEQSGLNVTSRRLVTLAACVGLSLGITVGLLRQSIVLGGVAALIGAGVPLLYVRMKQKARMKRLLGQLPDAFELMARVIRAGQTMSQALQGVADEFDAPIAAEFAYCYEQQNLGLSPEVSLRDLARRSGLVEMKIFVLAMLVQQQTGGNLAELLDKLATLVRERFRMQGKIKALTAEGRFQAIVLLALPPAMLLLLLAVNRHYIQTLFEHPGLLVAMVIADVLGALWIRRIINFDY